jgi:6,7-dimethyl-8-ribityllumazine synthase
MTERWPGERLARDEDREDEEPEEELEPAEDEAEEGPEDDATPEAEDEAEEEPDEESEDEGEGVSEDTPVPQLRTAREHAEGELDIPDEVVLLEGTPEGNRRAVAIVAARFNGEITNKLLQSALDELEDLGVRLEAVTVMPVPGAFELPLAAMALAKTRRYACIVALGCVIRGETPHFEYVASEAASGLQLAALETGVPVAFGVLTVESLEQAESRVDKGAEAVRTALEMADAFAQLRASAAAR